MVVFTSRDLKLKAVGGGDDNNDDSMDPVQRCVAFVLVQFRSSVAVQELAFAILVVVWVPVFRSARWRERTEHACISSRNPLHCEIRCRSGTIDSIG